MAKPKGLFEGNIISSPFTRATRKRSSVKTSLRLFLRNHNAEQRDQERLKAEEKSTELLDRVSDVLINAAVSRFPGYTHR